VDWTPGYRELAPPEWLRGTLSCLWVAVARPDRPRQTLVLPDACADLIWSRGGAAFLAGPDTGPAAVTSAPGAILVGARFRPGAAGSVLRLALTEVADQRVDAGQIPVLRARVPSAQLPPQLALQALARLIADLAGERAADATVTHAARLLARPGASAEEIAGIVGLSERQFRRRCQVGVGYGPRTLARILRFRRFVSALDAGSLPGGLAGAAITAGYADQPHLTRECVALSGLTPRALALARAS
jgi:transcriptional regulator GlxA family with amidase domain